MMTVIMFLLYFHLMLFTTISLADECPSPCTCQTENTEVYCNGTGLTEIPKNLPITTISLYLGSNQIKVVPTDSFSGLIHLQSLDLTDNHFKEGSIQDGALDLPSVANLDSSINDFTSIPQVLPPKLIGFAIAYNPIETLTASSFVKYPSIQYLTVSNTNLSKIEEHAFDPLTGAINIAISFNQLEDGSIPLTAFFKNQNLTYLSLRYNNIKTFPNMTYFPASLQNFDFVGNPITVIPSYGFRHLPNIQVIEIRDSPLSTLADYAFFGLTKVTIINFMDNQISSTITNFTLDGLTALKTIYLTDNKISKIETGAFHSLTSIQDLWLSDNKLSTLDPKVLDTKFMPRLSSVFMDFNPWICDCHLKWLREKMDNATYTIMYPHIIVCSGPPKVAGKAWDVLKPEDFVCEN